MAHFDIDIDTETTICQDRICLMIVGTVLGERLRPDMLDDELLVLVGVVEGISDEQLARCGHYRGPRNLTRGSSTPPLAILRHGSE